MQEDNINPRANQADPSSKDLAKGLLEKDPGTEDSTAKLGQDSSSGKHDRKIDVLQKMGTVLVVLGILGILLPFFNSFLLARNSDIDLANVSADSMAKAAESVTPVAFDAIKEIGYVDFWPLLGKWKSEDIMAELHIPSLDLEQAIFNSASNTNLLAGVGTLVADRTLDDSNFVITGHHVKGKGVLLHNLMDAQKGTTVYITDKQDIYVYKIVDAIQKDTDAIYMLSEDQNEAYDTDSVVTIMTCYQGKVSSRWFVVAELVDVVPYDASILEAEYNLE